MTKKAYISIPVTLYEETWVRDVISSIKKNMLTISPNDFITYNKSIMHNHIISSDLIVVVEKKNGYIGKGSYEEISLALEKEVNAYAISNSFIGMRQIKSTYIDNSRDWRNYAKLTF